VIVQVCDEIMKVSVVHRKFIAAVNQHIYLRIASTPKIAEDLNVHSIEAQRGSRAISITSTVRTPYSLEVYSGTQWHCQSYGGGITACA